MQLFKYSYKSQQGLDNYGFIDLDKAVDFDLVHMKDEEGNARRVFYITFPFTLDIVKQIPTKLNPKTGEPTNYRNEVVETPYKVLLQEEVEIEAVLAWCSMQINPTLQVVRPIEASVAGVGT
jgi:hypothetical protein